MVEILIFVSSALISLVLFKFHVIYSWAHGFLPESAILLSLFKALMAFLLMVIPTTLMGATLPIISKYYVTENSQLNDQIGILYFLNTLGASIGCLLTGYFFISTFGVLQTALYASAANLIIGIGCIRIVQEENPEKKFPLRLPVPKWPGWKLDSEKNIFIAVSFICGFTALAYEVLWTRLLVFSIASTVYSFSMMLAVFLLGICIGSILSVPLIARFKDLKKILWILQAGICAYILFSLYSMEFLLSSPWNSYNLQKPAETIWRYFKDSSSLMLFPTILFGMNFPILIKLTSEDPEHIGGGTGAIYSVNTLGAILGSLIAGFILLPVFGTERSLILIASMNLFLIPFILKKSGESIFSGNLGVFSGATGLVLLLNIALPGDLLKPFFMRDSAGKRDLKKLVYFEEGLTDTVAVFKDNYGILDPEAKRLITNGISMSASNVIATRYMKLFAHVPILLSDNPEQVLVICFGTGQTTGAAGIHPRVQQVDSLDLSPSVIHAAPAFKEENHDAINNPKVNIILQDGRNHLLTTEKKYDVITGEPPPPRTAFTVNLYTLDFYKQAAKRLKPGGIIAQWVPLHSQSAEEVDMHFKTFLQVFPHAIAWMSVANEILLIGSDQPIEIDLKKLKERLSEPLIKQALEDIHISNVYSFLSNIWFFEDEMKKISSRSYMISDNQPRIEFYLNYPNVIEVPGLERLVFNRTPAQDIWKRFKNVEFDDWELFKKHFNVMNNYQRGVMYANRGLLLEAITEVENDELFRYHLQAGKNQVKNLLGALKENPNNVETLLNLGHVFYQIGEYEKSIEYLQKVLKKDPGNSFANLYLGYDFLELGNLKEAKKTLEEVVKKDPRQLRSVMQQMGLIELLTNLEKDPDDLNLLNATAQFYNVKNEFRKSLQYSLKILEKEPNNKQALQSAVFSYRGLGEPHKVISYGVRYERVEPEDLRFLYIMAEMYIQTLQCGKAVNYLKTILNKDDTYQNAQLWFDQCQNQLQEQDS